MERSSPSLQAVFFDIERDLVDSVPGLRSVKDAKLACVIVVNDYTKNEDFREADLTLDGYGAPGAPANIGASSRSIDFGGVLAAEVLSDVHASATVGTSA